MLTVLLFLAVLTLIFSIGLPVPIALILSTSLLTGAVATWWFARVAKRPVVVKTVVEADAKQEFRKKVA